MSLLGLAGSSAASVVSWLAPLMLGVSVVLLGRAHYLLHVARCGGKGTAIITWSATVLVVGFWTWQLTH